MEDKFQEELLTYLEEFLRIIQKNSPKRRDDSYPHVIKRKGVIISPFPGNLKQNGNQKIDLGDGAKLKHGYEPARYALYANERSKKPQYIEKSIARFTACMESLGWEQE